MAMETTRSIEIHELAESPLEIAELVSELCSYCSEMELDVSESDAELCVRHLLMVNQVNQYMNLTRIADIHDALILHIVDSLALSKILPFEPERFLDMGTGAGFPGVPLGILLSCEGVLLDSVGKKVNAVNAFIAELGLESLVAVHDRAETFALHEPESYDLVLARAVGQSGMLIEYAAPCLEMDGYLLLAKANLSDDEFRVAQKTAEICGLELVGQTEFDLPRELGHRTVLLYQKVDEPRVLLPRAVGLAKREPLAK